jgi:hypothetical protein
MAEVRESGGEIGRRVLMGQIGRMMRPGAFGEIAAEEFPVAVRGHAAFADVPPKIEPRLQLLRRPAPQDGDEAPLAVIDVGGQLFACDLGDLGELLDVPASDRGRDAPPRGSGSCAASVKPCTSEHKRRCSCPYDSRTPGPGKRRESRLFPGRSTDRTRTMFIYRVIVRTRPAAFDPKVVDRSSGHPVPPIPGLEPQPPLGFGGEEPRLSTSWIRPASHSEEDIVPVLCPLHAAQTGPALPAGRAVTA